MKLILTRPLSCLDAETTGKNPAIDRICQLAVIIIQPDKSTTKFCRLINPGVPIPPEATAVHGITDEMVKDAPSFSSIAKSLHGILKDKDLLTYNGNNFDIPLLAEEFNRCGLAFPSEDQKLLDAQVIFHKKEERSLAAAHKFYLGSEMTDAHDAGADTLAALKVFFAQVEKYEDLSEMETVEQLAEFCKRDNRLDLEGKFVKAENGDVLITFGKYRDQPVQVAFKDKGYLTWLKKAEFTANTKRVLNALIEEVNNK